MPHEREAVAVQARRFHRNDDVAILHQVCAELGVCLDGPDGRTGDVIVVWTEKPRMLGSLAPDQRRSGCRTGARDAGDDVGDP